MVNEIFSCRVFAPIPPARTGTIDWMHLSTLSDNCFHNSVPIFLSLLIFFAHTSTSWYYDTSTATTTRNHGKCNDTNYETSNIYPVFSQVFPDISEEREQIVLCESGPPCNCVFPPICDIITPSKPLSLELWLDCKLSGRGGSNSEGCGKGNLFDLHFFRRSCLLF